MIGFTVAYHEFFVILGLEVLEEAQGEEIHHRS